MNQEKPWDKNLQLLLVAIVTFNVAPHVLDAPIWVSLIAVCGIIWKYLYLTRGTQLPSKVTLQAGSVLAVVLTLAYFGTLLGNEASGALLVALASFKLLETNRYRDAMLVIFTSYFLLMVHLLRSQTLFSTLYMAIDVLLITTLLFHVHKRDRRRSPRSLRPAMKLLAVALPVWIFLFVVFPRFTAAFVGIQKPQGASTGYSEGLNPGSVGELVDSEEVAFRAVLPDELPGASRGLYWRGSVLDQNDGLRWSRSPLDYEPEEALTEIDSEKSKGATYTIYLEPKFGRHLFALEYSESFGAADQQGRSLVRQRIGQTFELKNESASRLQYRGNAAQEAPKSRLAPFGSQRLLRVPDLAPSVHTLAKTLKREADDAIAANPKKHASRAEAYHARVMRWFKDEDFRYSRNPGILAGETSEEHLASFLFENRRGFCEHYAAAYSNLMRLMGIPARVVIGFQGGTENDIGGYVLVRDLDAHAWAEVFVVDEIMGAESRDLSSNGVLNALEGRWVRTDPTASIAPMRLEMGGEFNLLDDESMVAGLTGAALKRHFGGARKLLLRVRLYWDLLQMRWNAFLDSYDFNAQMDILRKLGIANPSRLILITLMLLGVTTFGLAMVFVLRKRARQEDPVLATWSRFCRSVERDGLRRGQTEGPLAFSERVISAHPKLATLVQDISAQFIALRYESNLTPKETKDRLKAFRQSVRRFSKRSSSRFASS